MLTKLDVEPVVGATEALGGWAEVIWPCIQVWGGTKRGLEETVGTELRGVVGVSEVLQRIAIGSLP